ncbi:sporulation peptidase YabG [Clostridium thermobutyricum]|uniref:Sporulation-specific protease YabG n=1 Tax=Clostridium thermobutyricum DSM 4928 TaxID=1121339 RepID=A0A1V4SWY0_9CLOT|nr:sporulation peptidase YabG [Clostridium thermobutyricum]OPX49021.1 sporulation-specific protease YabG [Clostridium thermobutyricum DSM 4928]
MRIGDVVVRKSYNKDVTFKIVDIKEVDGKKVYILKGINIRIVADAKESDLETVGDSFSGEKDKILNSRVNKALKNIMIYRDLKERKGDKSSSKAKKAPAPEKDELFFGRPGKILHIDGDSEYLDTCLKVYKQLSLEAVGEAVPESKQPERVVELVKKNNPDIVVLTGHDSVLRNTNDYLNLNNYRNTKYYIESVKALREYNNNYDELIIFAGACQSCYECILDAGANFASSPSRVLIHCLDPVFVCEKIAYSNIDEVIPIKDIIENTITGSKGIGGLQTRGKYRKGYPKSPYL